MNEDNGIIPSEIPGIQQEDQSFAEAIKIPLKMVRTENYLGDPLVVQYLIRSFAQKALARRGEMSDADATNADVTDSKSIARIFLGQDPDYPPMETWNKPGQIDQWIANRLNISGTPDEVLSQALIIFLVEIYKLYNQSVFGGLSENIDWQVDACCEDTTKLFLGIAIGNYTEADLAAMQSE